MKQKLPRLARILRTSKAHTHRAPMRIPWIPLSLLSPTFRAVWPNPRLRIQSHASTARLPFFCAVIDILLFSDFLLCIFHLIFLFISNFFIATFVSTITIIIIISCNCLILLFLKIWLLLLFIITIFSIIVINYYYFISIIIYIIFFLERRAYFSIVSW